MTQTRPLLNGQARSLTRFDIHHQVATLTMDDPGRRNALGDGMKAEFIDALRQVQDDRSIRALVLTGSGGSFCAGGDLRRMAAAPLDAPGWRERLQDLHTLTVALITLDRPVIAAVDGAAFGAGFSLALAADIVLASPRARMCMSFMRVGLVPDCGALYTLPRVVGAQRAKELMLSARELGAEEALRLGIVMEILPAEGLLARAQEMAASFVGASATAVGLIKRAVQATGPDLSMLLDLEASAQAVAGSTAAHREAVARFGAKQAPLFQWPDSPKAPG
jgi:2-(1,2-epoxy-1,2-dihydrophenyl)acetyl-CoA isomerase